MSVELIHSERTLRQLAEARAKHAARCEKIVTLCAICTDYFAIVRKS